MRSAKGVDILINRKIDIAVYTHHNATKMRRIIMVLMAICVKTCPCVLVNRAPDTEICFWDF